MWMVGAGEGKGKQLSASPGIAAVTWAWGSSSCKYHCVSDIVPPNGGERRAMPVPAMTLREPHGKMWQLLRITNRPLSFEEMGFRFILIRSLAIELSQPALLLGARHCYG